MTSSLLNNTLCQVKEKYHDTVCTERLCKKCGVDSWNCHVEQQLEEKLDLIVTWSVWQFVDAPAAKSNPGVTETIKRRIKVNKNDTLKNLLMELCTASQPLAEHLEVAAWQREMTTSIRSNPPLNTVVMLSDFAENIRNEHPSQVCTACALL